MKFLIFAASHRPESYNRKLAAHAAHHLSGKDVEVDFAEYGQFDMPIYNDAIAFPDIAHSFAKRAASADGIIISSPEYNWSYPGSLKNIIDWTSRINPHPLKGKTALLLSASTSMRGGIVGLSHLKSPLEASHMYLFPKVFPLGNCIQAFDAAGALDPRPAHALNAILDDYVTFTRQLTNSM